VEHHLHLFTNSQQNDWVTHLPTAEFVLNNHMHFAYQITPVKVIYGYRPDFTIPVGLPIKFPALDSYLCHLHNAQQDAEAILCQEKCIMKQTFEAGKLKLHIFTTGQKVWLSSKDISLSHSNCKLNPRQLGSYDVIECIGKLTYRLNLPLSMH